MIAPSVITAPVLLCQGFQRAFVDTASPMFSASASMRRSLCEGILRRARASGWTIVHTFIDSHAVRGAGEATIQGFSPLPTEAYFWQTGLAPFGLSPAHPFDRLLSANYLSPVFLMSFAGLGAISATLMAGLERQYAMQVVIDAVADAASNGIDERDRLRTIETLARACECAVTSDELATLSPAASPHTSRAQAPARIAPALHLLSQTGS